MFFVKMPDPLLFPSLLPNPNAYPSHINHYANLQSERKTTRKKLLGIPTATTTKPASAIASKRTSPTRSIPPPSRRINTPIIRIPRDMIIITLSPLADLGIILPCLDARIAPQTTPHTITSRLVVIRRRSIERAVHDPCHGLGVGKDVAA